MGRYDLPEDMVIYRYIDDSLQSWSNQFPVKNDDISSRVVFQRFSRPRENITSPLAEVTEEVSFVNYGPKWYLVKGKMGPSGCWVIGGLEVKNNQTGAMEGTFIPAVQEGQIAVVCRELGMGHEMKGVVHGVLVLKR